MNQTTCTQQFNREAITLIRIRLENAETPDDFLTQIEELSSNADCLQKPSNPIELERQLSAQKSDAENAVALFEGVGEMDRDNAALPGLWTYMAFNTCKEYMLDRWPLEGSRNWKNRVKQRWILPDIPSRGRLIRHGISRLWWVAELTYDGSLEHKLSKTENDPYAYTRWTMAVENRIIQLFDRSVGDDPKVLWAVMDSMQKSDTSRASDAVANFGRDILLEMSNRQLGMLNSDELESTTNTILEQAEQETKQKNR